MILDLNNIGSFIRDYGPTISTIGLIVVTAMYTVQVKRQSEAMMQQAGYDRLARKHERLVKEMTLLVGKLYGKKDTYSILKSGGYNDKSEYFEDHHSFWEDIKRNMYLAQPDLRLKLNEYFIAENTYRSSPVNEYVEHAEDAKKTFHDVADGLIQQVKISYRNLNDEIKKAEKELYDERN